MTEENAVTIRCYDGDSEAAGGLWLETLKYMIRVGMYGIPPLSVLPWSATYFKRKKSFL